MQPVGSLVTVAESDHRKVHTFVTISIERPSTPVSVVGVTSATSLAAGANHTCARLSSGAVSCWGYGVLGEIGNGQNVTQLKPVAVSNITNAVAVRASGEDACALLQDGSIVCWGQNVDGQLGDGTLTLGPIPQFVIGL